METRSSLQAATRHFPRRIALVFDFDGTIVPDTVDHLLRHCGQDPERFRQTRVQPLIDDGWEGTLARMYALVELSRSSDGPTITRDTLREVGRQLTPFDGVPEMFDAVRRCAGEIVEGIEVEFYLLTCAFEEIPKATSIASEFTAIWGSAFYYDADGRIAYTKKVITFPEKERYLIALSKGLTPVDANEPEDIYQDVDDEDLHVPISQMIYVGDGGSDMPAFRLMNAQGGIAIGVYKGSREDWDGYEHMRRHRRVQNLAPADFSSGGELMRSIELAVESTSKLIALRRLGDGE